MSSLPAWPAEVEPLLAVVAAVLDGQGVLLQANAGLLRILPAEWMPPLGARVARFFVQPSFGELLRRTHEAGSNGYRGLLTVGEYAGGTRTLLGEVIASGAGIRVLAEYDVAEIERISRAVSELNGESSLLMRAVVGANVALKQQEVLITEQSLTDPLTGVGNRRKLDQVLAVEVARVRRTGGGLCAIMADVDHFKRVNDTWGHDAGDKVLAHLGAMLRQSTRPMDTVTRFGGEEFVLLLPHTTLAQALVKAEQMRAALEAARIEPLPDAVTASFGVAELGPGEEGPSLLARVDAALYRAKAGGRNRVVAAGHEGR